MKTKRMKLTAFIALVAFAFVAYGFVGGAGGGNTTYVPKNPPRLGKKAGDAYLFKINNIAMPMNRVGVMANVTIGGFSNGNFEGHEFLFSGGFFMSGKNPNGTIWANAVASASRIQDYEPGRALSQSTDDPQIYVVDGNEPDFGQDWQDWSGAVALGAGFYDGDNDGQYTPIDKNGNGKWDPDEDRPDLLGDQTAWCVYTDKVPSAQRRYTEVSPRGIDIQQSVFGFKSAGLLGNMIFIRYRIINSGQFANQFDSVFFGVWADPDLGDYNDDLVGSDTLLNSGFTWNDGIDAQWGSNPPCFLIDFFQGPIVFIPGVTFTDVNSNGVYDPGVDVALDTAYNRRGQVLGVDTVAGAKNLGLSSFVNYVQSNPDRGDPSTALEARGYNTGRLKTGAALNPCADPFGTVYGIPCTEVNPTFWYSGDPTVAPFGYGWIYTVPGDVRQMQNVGPFTLKANEPVDIVVAYVVGRGTDARNSVAVAKNIDRVAQFIFDRNFDTPPPPPVVRPMVRTTEKTIELIWDTHEQMQFRNVTQAWDMRFQGYEVTMYNSPTTAATSGGQENARVIARYDKADRVHNILIEKANGERVMTYFKDAQIDSATYATKGVGRIRLVISTDPFTGGPLLKGRPYFFSITGYALNEQALVPVNPNAVPGDFLLSSAAFAQNTANVPVLINGSTGIIPGLDMNNPYRPEELAQVQSGVAQGRVYFDEVLRDSLTGHDYKVSFFKDNAQTAYTMLWKVEDVTANAVKIDSVRIYPDSLDYAVRLVDGMRIRPVPVAPSILATSYSNTTRWYTLPGGIYYGGKDLPTATTAPALFSNKQSKAMVVDKMRRVEIRFGPTQKAYRYVNGFAAFGTQPPNQVYEYAAGMELRRADTTGGIPPPPNFKKGYVDVPFQVWIKDLRHNTERQVNCAFMENRAPRLPDGIWNPTANLDSTTASGSREYIVVFDTPYSPDTSLVYTGGIFNGVRRFANIVDGWTKPAQWGTIMSAEDSIRANDQLLGAMYVVPFQRRILATGDTLKWADGEVFTIPVSYPFTSADVFTYKASVKGGSKSTEAAKADFSRVTVYPNPLFAYNPGTSYIGQNPDDPYVTFSNLPENVTIKIYSLSGTLVRTLTTADKGYGSTSPFLTWNLQNERGLRVASGMYLAIVSAPGVGEKVLKFAIIMPQKQIQRF